MERGGRAGRGAEDGALPVSGTQLHAVAVLRRLPKAKPCSTTPQAARPRCKRLLRRATPRTSCPTRRVCMSIRTPCLLGGALWTRAHTEAPVHAHPYTHTHARNARTHTRTHATHARTRPPPPTHPPAVGRNAKVNHLERRVRSRRVEEEVLGLDLQAPAPSGRQHTGGTQAAGRQAHGSGQYRRTVQFKATRP